MQLSWLSTVLLCSRLVLGHPSASVPVRSKCDAETQNVTFFSYHVHVLFEVCDKCESQTAALQLQKRFASAFSVSTEVDVTACDDFNSTHGLNPPLCMIDNDWGPRDPEHGHYRSPACPFTVAEWAVFVPPSDYAHVVPWFMANHGSLSVMVHSNSGCEVYDHRDWPLWGGESIELDLTCLHYDCPGCNFDDCQAKTDGTVLNGTDELCGLQVIIPEPESGDAPYLTLRDVKLFCSSQCVRWARKDLQAWALDCPNNCDVGVVGNSSMVQQTCHAHLRSLADVLSWSQQLCK